MMVYPSSIVTEFYNGSSWVNISTYVVSEITCKGGFYTSNPIEFSAGVGVSTFDLDNSGGLFTVYGGDAVHGLSTLTGWNRGAKIRHRVTYLHYNKVVWLGFVQDMVSDDGTWGDKRVHVTCLDWIDVASRYPMKRSGILTDKNAGQGFTDILGRVSKAPEGMITGTYSTTFDAIFNDVRSKTKAVAELDKLARSEMGYVYVTKDGYLKAEGHTARSGASSLTQVPYPADTALMAAIGNALMVSTDNVLLIDGNKDAQLTLTSEKLDLEMGDEFWNDGYMRSYPVVKDASPVVLFKIGSAIPIMGGMTIEIVGNYSNPNGGNPCNGEQMQAPTKPTDGQMFQNADGTGTDLTANLDINATYYGDVVVYRLRSIYTGGVAYITKLQARGVGIYRDSYAESHIYITGSAASYGDKAFELNQTYQSTPYAGDLFGASILELYKTPKTRIMEARYCANLNSDQMMAFLHLDIGDLIKVYDNRSQMYKWYHIIARNLIIFLGGIIVFSFGLREHPSIASGGLSHVPIDFSGKATGDAIDFGYLPEVSGDGVTSYSVTSWLYLRSVWTSFTTILNIYADTGANTYFMLKGTSGDRILAFQSFRFSSNSGRWVTPSNVFMTGTWAHVAVTHNLDVSADPTIYINGVAQTLTEESIPGGTLLSAEGARLVIGNAGGFGNGVDGILKDVRFYNRILTSDEISNIYNGGVMDTSLVTNGLVFQGLAINSDLGTAASLNGQQIPANEKYFENILRRVGTPNGTPLIVNQ